MHYTTALHITLLGKNVMHYSALHITITPCLIHGTPSTYISMNGRAPSGTGMTHFTFSDILDIMAQLSTRTYVVLYQASNLPNVHTPVLSNSLGFLVTSSKSFYFLSFKEN